MPSMSSAARHHGIQSCLQPWQAHPLKKPTHNWPPAAAAPPPPTSNGGWSSLYSLPQPSQSPLDAIDKSSHKTPTPIPSTSYNNHLCKKNWELCTETLGCETGAAYTLPIDSPLKRHSLGALPNFPTTDSPSKRQSLGGSGTEIRKRRTTTAFPPPLTTLSGEAGFRLKSRRQEGRLLLLPFNPNVFQAERKDGRLRLRMLPGAAAGCGREAEEVSTEDGEDEDYLGVVGREMNGDRGFVGAPPPAGQLLIPLGRRISAKKKTSLVSKMTTAARSRLWSSLPLMTLRSSILLFFAPLPPPQSMLLLHAHLPIHLTRFLPLSRIRSSSSSLHHQPAAATRVLKPSTPGEPISVSIDETPGEPISVSIDDLFRGAYSMREEVGAFTALRKKREAQRDSLRRMEVEAAASAHTVLTANDLNMIISSWGFKNTDLISTQPSPCS